MKTKKIFVAVATIALIAVSCFALAACGPQPNIKVVDIKLTDEYYAFALTKGDTALMNTVNKVLGEISENGELKKLIDKYYTGGKVKGIESAAKDSSKDQLIVATNAAFAPFEYKQGDKFVGIDMEIAKMIADELGQELVIEDMDFDSVITAMPSGIADIGMAGLTVNDERRQTLDFSDTYYNASQTIITLADDTTFDDCKSAEDVVAILNASEGKKIGVQSGTTGNMWVVGDEGGFGYKGFANIKCVAESNAGLAVKDMRNGKVDWVIVDDMPAVMLVKSINK